MSIVLVIIGLVVGGVLVGYDLIRASEVRAQITQIEKYNAAVNTFRGKYNALPGDMNATTAATFSFASRGAYAGEGDGNGILESTPSNVPNNSNGCNEGRGENTMFWVDLTTANGLNINLIEGGFSSANETGGIWSYDITGTMLNLYFPQAQIGRGNYVYVWSGGWAGLVQHTAGNGINYFGLSAIARIDHNYGELLVSTPNIPVSMAYSIDTKMDDGFPQTGNVTAMYLGDVNGSPAYAAGSGVGAAPGAAAAASSTTCYDNGNNASAPMQYSMGFRNGSYPNCALSFKFQ